MTAPLPRNPAAASRQGQVEFIALMGMLTAMVAFAIDSMLPALPAIGAELVPGAPNRAQLVLTAFVFGMGLGTFLTGPLADALGRRPVLLGGAALYALGALFAWAAPSLEWLLAARLIQGLGAAGPRVACIAVVRDRHAGRDMARIMSFIMMVFALVPAIAPALGALVIGAFGWRAVFLSFVAFAGTAALWLALRLPETLPPAARRPLRARLILAALREIAGNRTVVLTIAAQTLAFAMLFAVLSSTQQVFDITYGRGASFPGWFALIAVLAGSASFVNARLVVRLGMRAIVRAMFAAQIALSAGMIAAILLPLPQGAEFAVYLVWTVSVFFQAGLTIGNLNAMGMEPLGHLAGIAASVIAAIATVGSVLIAAPIGLAFDGTALPVAAGILACATGARILTGLIRPASG
jgi:DHA1 family bicyclomycin/chloramphenicol resistance-like MFS transporter